MVSRPPVRSLALILTALVPALVALECAPIDEHEATGHQNFASPQAKPIALSHDGALLFVANTTSNSVSVIGTADLSRVVDIEVGLEPVGLAVKPDGSELWVSNHVSDSVSVIDLDPGGPTFLRIIATIQDLDANGVTQFDEPVGIAFASDAKAYVALSSRNDVAIVDTATHAVTGRIHITAQEPRALTVRDDRLYVAAFESGNQSELSACPNGGAPPACTLDAEAIIDFIVANPNIPAEDKNIVINPAAPDRDLFVIDTQTDTVIDTVSGVGTLLYDLVVDTNASVFITMTDALNADNGLEGENLIDLQNRLFLNQIGRVGCGGAACALLPDIELEPPVGSPIPTPLATPYGLALSDDDGTLIATAAGTSRAFSVDAATGAILDVLDLNDGAAGELGQQIPKGVALASDGDGAPLRAYVLNTLENTVSVLDVQDPADLQHVAKVPVGNDPTSEGIRRGRIAFNNAFASSSGTFSCESCHPDGNTDQLLWRIGGACFFEPCTGNDESRSTMPVRGLKNTLPLHWDGALGDPFGGPNGAVNNGTNLEPSCTLGDADGDHDCFLDLVMGSLSGVMCDQDPATNPAGCPPGGNELSAAARDDLATFLGTVQYPPARARAMDDQLSASARQGFSDFFVDVGGVLDLLDIRTCADMNSGCHSLPLMAETNSQSLGGFDVPTLRGLNDRWLQFSLGISLPIDVLDFVKTSQTATVQLGGLPPIQFTTLPSAVPFEHDQGFEEDMAFATAFVAFQPLYAGTGGDIFQMLDEHSTGYTGALGRQLTLNASTTGGGALAATEVLWDLLEAADARGQVNLRATGTRRYDGIPAIFTWEVLSRRDDGSYRNTDGTVTLSRAELLAEAQAGDAVLTLTAALPQHYGSERQPLLNIRSRGNGPVGNPDLPLLVGGEQTLLLASADVRGNASLLLDGALVGGSLACDNGSFSPYCDGPDGHLTITLDDAPSGDGLHLLQVQNPSGPLSPELPFCVGSAEACQ